MSITTTTLGRISSYYYLSHLTLRMFNERLHADCSLPDLIKILAVRMFVIELDANLRELGLRVGNFEYL